MVAFPAPPQPEVFHVGLVAALLSLALGILFVLRNLAFVEPQTGNQKYPYFTDQGVIQSIIVLLLFLATWFGSCWLYSFTRVSSVLEQFWPWMVGVGVVYAAPYFLLFRFLKGEDASAKVPEAGNRPWWVLTLSAPVAGAVGGLLLWGLAKLFQSWGDTPSASGHLASWGTPLMILVFTLTAVVHMSLIGRRLSNEQQEWWSRLGGWILVYTLGWVVLFGMALYSPLALMWVGDVGGDVSLGVGGGAVHHCWCSGWQDSCHWLTRGQSMVGTHTEGRAEGHAEGRAPYFRRRISVGFITGHTYDSPSLAGLLASYNCRGIAPSGDIAVQAGYYW
jgi:hypothetical protein